MSLLVLSATEVGRVTASFSPEELQVLMAQVFIRLSACSGVFSPPRISLPTENHTALFMPSRIAEMGTAIKVVSVPSSPADTRGLPASTLVLDENTGATKAIINARTLTALRTAAGSVLATRMVGPSAPLILLAFGAGAQIEAHVDLHLRAFPSIIACVIVNRSLNARVQGLCTRLRARHSKIKVAPIAPGPGAADQAELRRWVSTAGIICTATSATTPLFPGEWVLDGTHINLIGSYKPTMHEVDTTLIRRAGRVVVDSRQACLAEAGELIDAGVKAEEMLELGELVRVDSTGVVESLVEQVGEARSGRVTIFKSVGVGLQDVAIATAVVQRAEAMDIGTKIGSYDIS